MKLHPVDRIERPPSDRSRLSLLELAGGVLSVAAPIALVLWHLAPNAPSSGQASEAAAPVIRHAAADVDPSPEPSPVPEGLDPPEREPGQAAPARPVRPTARATARSDRRRSRRPTRSVDAELESLTARAAELSGAE